MLQNLSSHSRIKNPPFYKSVLGFRQRATMFSVNARESILSLQRERTRMREKALHIMSVSHGIKFRAFTRKIPIFLRKKIPKFGTALNQIGRELCQRKVGILLSAFAVWHQYKLQGFIFFSSLSLACVRSRISDRLLCASLLRFA